MARTVQLRASVPDSDSSGGSLNLVPLGKGRAVAQPPKGSKVKPFQWVSAYQQAVAENDGRKTTGGCGYPNQTQENAKRAREIMESEPANVLYAQTVSNLQKANNRFTDEMAGCPGD